MSLKLTDGCLKFANNITRDISFDEVELPEYITSFSPIMSPEAEMSFECELSPLASKLLGIDLANGPDMTSASVIFKHPRQIQVRRHKKKRINKKWNKKFGPRYITTFQLSQLEEVRFERTGPEIMVVGERARMITPNGPLYI